MYLTQVIMQNFFWPSVFVDNECNKTDCECQGVRYEFILWIPLIVNNGKVEKYRWYQCQHDNVNATVTGVSISTALLSNAVTYYTTTVSMPT